MNFLWISCHQLTQGQLCDLHQFYSKDLTVRVVDQTLSTIHTMLPHLAWADVIGAVLPMELLAELVQAAAGKPVLVAHSQRVPTGKTIMNATGHSEHEYRFEHTYWEQIDKLELATHRLVSSSPCTENTGQFWQTKKVPK